MPHINLLYPFIEDTKDGTNFTGNKMTKKIQYIHSFSVDSRAWATQYLMSFSTLLHFDILGVLGGMYGPASLLNGKALIILLGPVFFFFFFFSKEFN